MWFFNDFRGPEGIEISEKSEKIEPGVFWNAQKPPGMGRIDRIGGTSCHSGPNGGSMEIQWRPRGD